MEYIPEARMYEGSFCSNESSEYELNSDTLDQLYKEQLHMLRELVFKQNRTEDIELCRKWLKIFSKTSKGEKMARNCLCSLMQQQLQDEGTLSEPFTNLQNCNRDLERVLQELDAQSYISANYLQQQQQQIQTMRTSSTSHGQSYRHYQHQHQHQQQQQQQQQYKHKRRQMHQLHCTMLRHQGHNGEHVGHGHEHGHGQCVYEIYENVENGSGDANGIFLNNSDCTNCEHDMNVINPDDTILSDNRAGGDDGKLHDDLSTECEENEKLTENLLLRRELEALRLQLTEKEIENIRLKEIAEKYQMDNSKYENSLEGIRKNLLVSIKKALQHWTTAEEREEEKEKPQKTPKAYPMKLFEMIFKDIEVNAEFTKTIKAYDIEFEQRIAKRFEDEVNRRKAKMSRHISRKFVKGKKRIQEKYEQRLRMQNWAQRLQLKLVKLKCFSALRQMFINAQLTKDDDGSGGSSYGVNGKMWEMLHLLEEKYQTIVNEII